jgi:hypothetical protein
MAVNKTKRSLIVPLQRVSSIKLRDLNKFRVAAHREKSHQLWSRAFVLKLTNISAEVNAITTICSTYVHAIHHFYVSEGSGTELLITRKNRSQLMS